MKVILASASERRKELLKILIEDYSIIVSDFDEETVEVTEDIGEYVKNIAFGKAEKVVKGLEGECLVISADTVVSIDNRILGKPKDEKDAFNMLKTLSGRTHKVYSGVVVWNTKSMEIIKKSVVTEVTFSPLKDEEIKRYIENDNPYDKAGSYGIQGKAAPFVKEIKGCFYNVVGLPLNVLKDMIEKVK